MGALDHNSKLLREIRQALIRLDTGTLGICLDCGEDIGVKRLAAVPWTTSCIVCQEAMDSTAGQQPWTVSEEVLVAAD